MTKKIFRAIFTVALSVLLAGLILVLGVLYDYFGSIQSGQLKTELALAADGVENAGLPYLEQFDRNDCRLTWVAADGTVLFDSRSNAEDMENHVQREEISEAMQYGVGESARYSTTLTEKTMYYAQRLTDGTVLRVSVSSMTIPALLLGMLQPVLVILVVALILSAVLAGRLSKKIVEPLNALDLDKPMEGAAYDEISPLLRHIEQQHRQIRYQKEELEKRQSEFSAVTRSMEEGLVLLNRQGVILSINPAAAAFFSAEEGCVGGDFISIERNLDIGRTLDTAAEKGRCELQLSRKGREYQLNASRIMAGEQASGIAILIFDITDKVFAERNRREFTANVSHELKTPLQSIMGSAELIENGLVKSGDMPRFVGNIRAEAARLVTLIDDIIRLSRLDEKSELPEEELDLYQLAADEVISFEQLAKAKNVTISIEGEKTAVKGVPRLFHEIVYNLVENAVKYNVDGGSVAVTVRPDEKGAVLSVADTGIGIPAEHQARVFERFYRVDKSHSKETGGTGLGLSIVKHAAQYMGGKISMDSVPGKGTTISVCFER